VAPVHRPASHEMLQVRSTMRVVVGRDCGDEHRWKTLSVQYGEDAAFSL